MLLRPLRENVGAVPSFGSATARDTFFSSLMESSNDASRGVTFPSTRAETSSNAVAALSNFWKSFNFKLPDNKHSVSFEVQLAQAWCQYSNARQNSDLVTCLKN